MNERQLEERRKQIETALRVWKNGEPNRRAKALKTIGGFPGVIENVAILDILKAAEEGLLTVTHES
jgi:hypothetical protein